jgi:hypothetical protein
LRGKHLLRHGLFQAPATHPQACLHPVCNPVFICTSRCALTHCKTGCCVSQKRPFLRQT